MGCTTVGRFEVERELLSVPLFSVYKARAPKTQRIVAVYAVRLESIAGQQLAARFRETAKQASVLNSPNIASIYGGGTDAGLFLIAFEYVDGTSLRTMMDEGQEFSTRELIDLARQVCCGLDHAHHRGLFHPNLHPGNILVEADGTAKIMDFGVPKDVTFPAPDPPSHKFHYVSPEQVKGGLPDARSNVFSWGAILYELLTGKQAFPASNAEELRHEILEKTPPAPHELNAAIPEGISRAVMKALAKDPAARQQRGSGLVFELENSLQAEKPQTPPVRAAAEIALPRPTPVVSAPAPPTASVPAEPAGHVFQGEIPATLSRQPLPAGAAGLPSVFQASEAQPAAVPAVPIKTRAVAAVRDATTKLTSKEAEKRLSNFLARAVPVGAVLAGVLVILGIVSYIQARIASRPAAAPAPVAAAPAPAPPPGAEEAAPVEPASAEAEVEPEVVVIQSADPSAKPKRRRAAPKSARIPASLTIPTGGVAISSVPEGAQIQIDGYGEPNWRTPYLAANITAGPHTVTLTKAGYATRSETVQVEGGKRASLVASLAELAATVAVASEPAGAAVIVDGKETGRFTPAQIVVAKGSHTFTVRKAGYFDYSTDAQVVPGQTVRLNAPLRAMGSTDDIQTAGGRFNKLISRQPKDMASLQIKTRPKGARIMINNRMMDKATPAEFFVHPGHYEIVLSLPGYKSLRKTVSVDTTAKLVLDETLEQ